MIPSWPLAAALWPLRKASGAIAALLRWLLADIRHLAIAGLALFALVLWLRLDQVAAARDDWQASSARWQRVAGAWQGAARHIFADVEQARRDAAELDTRNVARVEREMTATIERTANDYQTRLSDRDVALERLRDELARAGAAITGGGGGAEQAVPEPFTARCRAFGAADCDALLAALPDQLAAAEENTARLIGLQGYVRTILAIDFSGGPDKAPE